jgi:twitching motility protein PilT
MIDPGSHPTGMPAPQQDITTQAGEHAPAVPPSDASQIPSIPWNDGPAHLEGLLSLTVQQGGSDLHLSSGNTPHIRIDGNLVPVDCGVLSADDVHSLAYSILTPARGKKFEEERELDFSFAHQDIARFRANYFFQRGRIGAAYRALPYEVTSLEALGLPEDSVNDFCARKKGLVLVTGATGSGKSTTLAAMIDLVNRQRAAHILTVEDPIEFVHESKRCLVDQREVGDDTKSFGTALKYALRQDPDVILIGEMRDLETIEAALTIAETGHLVFATLHTSDAVQTINRIIDVFPSSQQDQVRTQLSFVLIGIVSQQLLPAASGKGRALGCEVMIANHAIRTLIREGKVHQMYSMIQTGQKEGMQTMNASLYKLCTARAISYEDAIAYAPEPEELRRLIKVAGV